MNINSRHHDINSFDSRSRSRDVSWDLVDFAAQIQHRQQIHQRSYDDRTHQIPMTPQQINRNLEPMVLALNKHEALELKSLVSKHKNKQNNTQFLKDIQKVKSKVSSFKDKTQKVLSLKRYSESE